ncbi:MAG: hypothetical protein ACREJN_16190 [Nitrospiraceae bacterium]
MTQPEGIDPTVWTTKQGKRIKILDMPDDHLSNLISLLIRTAKINKFANLILMSNALALLQGEEARIAAEHEMDRLEATNVYFLLQSQYPQWDYLVSAAFNRNLPGIAEMVRAVE